jgi:ribosome-binding factor A
VSDTRRPDRVAEMIRAEVATLLTDGVKDPRIVGLVTVTGAEVTRDLRRAQVFVTIMGTEAEQTETLEGLASVAVHLRAIVGRRLRLRLAPEIVFRRDESVAYAARIESLLGSIKRSGDSAG